MEISFAKSKMNKKHNSILVEVVPQLDTISISLFDIAYSPYRKTEFIPTTLIPLIMQHYFVSAQLMHSYSDNHCIYKIRVKDLLAGPIKNWEYNRPPDLARCPDIARYIYNYKTAIDTMFYFSFNNMKEIFEVLDGIHRLTAIKIIAEENQKPQDLLCPSEFGCNNDATWFYNQEIIVNIRFNANIGTLIEVFQNLNKSQTVPDLYIRDHNKEKRDTIDAIANEWYVRYKRHFSSAAEPNSGNTNRNKFVDLLDKLYDKHKIDETNPNKLRQLLETANTKISQSIPSKAPISTRLRSKETGCYLFLYKNDKLLEFI